VYRVRFTDGGEREAFGALLPAAGLCAAHARELATASASAAAPGAPGEGEEPVPVLGGLSGALAALLYDWVAGDALPEWPEEDGRPDLRLALGGEGGWAAAGGGEGEGCGECRALMAAHATK
jgi:hypothetical protein